MMHIEIFWLLTGLLVVSSDYKLKHVQVLFRHGDRSPTTLYPTDINRENKWPRGLGQLTSEGIRQQYQLGLWLRQRYSSLIGPILNNSDIHVRSTDVDRTLMSAESNLAGFVFKENNQIISGFPWRPISIHTVRENVDYLLEFNICPRYTREREDLYNSDYFKKQFDPYLPFLKFLEDKTGFYNLKFSNLWEVFDAIYCEKTHNMTVNDWVTKEVWDKLLKLNVLNWELMFYKDLAKLSAGLLLYTVIDRMKNVTTNNPWNKDGFKYVVYSGHDTDIAPMAKLLGFYDNIQPPYASSVIFELYQSTNHSSDPWSVKVLYKNNTDIDQIFVHTVPGCPSDLCPLSLFIEVTKKLVMTRTEFMTTCGLERSIVLYAGIVFGTICAVLVLIIVIMFFVKRHRQNISGPRYSRFDGDKCIN